MISIDGYDKEEYVQCQSCLRSNEEHEIKRIKIGQTERQTVTLKLCKDCASELVKKISAPIMNHSDMMKFIDGIRRVELEEEIETYKNATPRIPYPRYLKAVRVTLISLGYCQTWVETVFRDALEEKYLGYKIESEKEQNKTDIPKEQYINIVKFTLECMKDLAKTDKNYNLPLDIMHYYNSAIKKENVITEEEFLQLCKDIGIQCKCEE